MAPRRRGGGALGVNDKDGLALAVLRRAINGGVRGPAAGHKLGPSSSPGRYYGTDEALLRRLKPSGPVIDASSSGGGENAGDEGALLARRLASPPTIAMAFSPLGGTLATASSDDVGKIRLWDTASRRPSPSPVVEVVRPCSLKKREAAFFLLLRPSTSLASSASSASSPLFSLSSTSSFYPHRSPPHP